MSQARVELRDRRHRILYATVGRVVKGEQLARQEGINWRTVIRDIEKLRAEGHDIKGERGVGYTLRPRRKTWATRTTASTSEPNGTQTGCTE